MKSKNKLIAEITFSFVILIIILYKSYEFKINFGSIAFILAYLCIVILDIYFYIRKSNS